MPHLFPGNKSRGSNFKDNTDSVPNDMMFDFHCAFLNLFLMFNLPNDLSWEFVF